MDIITVLGVLESQKGRGKHGQVLQVSTVFCIKLSASGASCAEFGRQLCPLLAV